MEPVLVLALVVVALVAGGLFVFGRLRRGSRERKDLPALPDTGTWSPVSSTPARYRKAPSGLRGQGPANEYDPIGMRIGDKVLLRQQPGQVVATIGYTEDVYAWTAVLVATGVHRTWLSVISTATGAGIEIVEWERLPAMPAEPTAREVTVRDVTYLYEESGVANYEAYGEVDLPGSGRSQYVDLVAGDHRLSFENFDDTGWDASIGRVLPIGDLVRAR